MKVERRGVIIEPLQKDLIRVYFRYEDIEKMIEVYLLEKRYFTPRKKNDAWHYTFKKVTILDTYEKEIREGEKKDA